MPRYLVTWREVRSCGAEVEAASMKDAIRAAKDGSYDFAEDYDTELDYSSYDAEEI